MNKILIFLMAVLLFSCKSKKFLTEGKAIEDLSYEKIIKNHYANKLDFNSLYIKASAKYSDNKQSQNITAEIKIKKNEKILISVRFLGITMAKALITPNKVSYYEKIDGSYFEGDYQSLSKWLGTDLDFDRIQNLLIGEPIDNLTNSKFIYEIEDKLYKLKNISDKELIKTYFFESENFLTKKQEIIQNNKRRGLTVIYPNYMKYDQLILPTGLSLEAFQENKITNIVMEYNTVTLNDELSFPYSVPDGYERILID